MSEACAGPVTGPQPKLIDFHPPTADMRADVLTGLALEQKKLLPKYFYDQRGSHLFDDITRLPEYYLTRTEDAVMETFLPEMAALIGAKPAVVEFGSGSGEKIRRLLRHLQEPVAAVTVEISRDHLMDSARSLATDFPELEVIAVCADFTQPFELPYIRNAASRLVFFPGSTIGNFSTADAVKLLRIMHQIAGPQGHLLIGVDLIKDHRVLEAAYNDAAGITAQFNLNLLRRINRELGADFNLDAFRHHAFFNANANRIEMHLISRMAQTVTVSGQTFSFRKGESILTEYAHKYQTDTFADLVGAAGFRVEQSWTDDQGYFGVYFLST